MLKDICLVAANDHSLFVDYAGNLYGCGTNQYRQLGLPQANAQNFVQKITDIPVAAASVSLTYSMIISTTGEVWKCGYNLSILGDSIVRTWELMENIPPMKQVSVGYSHALFLDLSGGVWTCGANDNGRTGIGLFSSSTGPVKIPNLPPMKAIAASWAHSAFIDEEDNLWMVGDRASSNVGLPDINNALRPRKIELSVGHYETMAGGYYQTIVSGSDKLFGFGRNTYGAIPFRNDESSQFHCKTVTKFTDHPILQISTLYHSIYLSSEGTVWESGTDRSDTSHLYNKPYKISNLPVMGRQKGNCKSARNCC